MSGWLVNTEGGSLTVACDVPDGYVASPPWRVVTTQELQALRDEYERDPVPASVSARQIRLWLVRAGIAMSVIEAAIDSIADEITRETVRVEWEYAPVIERAHPWLVPLASALGLDEAAVDRAFREAAGL